MPEEKLSRFTQNLILNALPEEDYNRLLPHLASVKLLHGQDIYHEGEEIKYVYFLDDGMLSITSTTEDGHNIEVGVIGREGMTGVNVVLGVDISYNDSMIQLPGGGFRMTTRALKEEFNRGGALQMLLRRYIHSIFYQISQTAVCNRIHIIEQRMARWLLMCHDRFDSDKLPLTQDFISMMLGVSRPSLTLAAIALQNAGFIAYKRGQVTILDRAGLEEFACECYRRVKAEYDRMPNE